MVNNGEFLEEGLASGKQPINAAHCYSLRGYLWGPARASMADAHVVHTVPDTFQGAAALDRGIPGSQQEEGPHVKRPGPCLIYPNGL